MKRPRIEIGRYAEPVNWTHWLSSPRHPETDVLGWVIFIRSGKLYFLESVEPSTGAPPREATFEIPEYEGELVFTVDSLDWNKGTDKNPEIICGTLIVIANKGNGFMTIWSYPNGRINLVSERTEQITIRHE